MNLVISCEHFSNRIPQIYMHLFNKHRAILSTHHAYDIGTAKVYAQFIKNFECYHQRGKYSRLLIDLNRTLNHTTCFSKFTRYLDDTTKQKIIDKYYLPYYSSLKNVIQTFIKQKSSVLHLSIHSFTPYYDEKIRRNDFAFLYDPQRQKEKFLCEQWRKHIQIISPQLSVRMNYPYRGTSNGLTSHFRICFSEKYYLGIEMEVNQKIFQHPIASQNQLIKTLMVALKSLVQQ